MQAGLYWSSEDFRLTVTSDLTVSSDAGVNAFAVAGLRTNWTPNLSDVNSGIVLALNLEDDGTTETSEGILLIDDLGISETTTLSGGANTVEFRAAVSVWRLADMTWQVDLADMGFYANGSLVTSLGTATITSAVLSTSSVPLLGMPATVYASAGSDVDPPFGLILSKENFSIGGTATATGGWSHDGVTHAVNADVKAGVATSCCDAGALPVPSLMATSTGEVTVTGQGLWTQVATFVRRQNVNQGNIGEQPLIQDIYTVDQKVTGVYSEMMALPDIDQGVIKLNSLDYSALIGRAGFPQAKHRRSGTCLDAPLGEPTVVNVDEEAQPEQSSFVGHVQSGVHPMEDTFAEPMVTPYNWSTSVRRRYGQVVDVIQPGIFLDPGPPLSEVPEEEYSTFCLKTQSATFPVVQTSGEQPEMPPVYAHENSHVARYLNTWGTRLGSFWYDFPQNYTEEDTPPDRRWEVQSQRATAEEYWQPIRQQWMGDSFLPSGDRTQTRNSIVSAPLREDRGLDWVGTYISGVPTSFWGISRFDVDTTEPISSFAWSQGENEGITGEDCTLTFGASRIVLDPIAASPCEVRVDLAQFDDAPFMYPHLCDRYKVNWDLTNVDSIEVYLENLEGERLLLTDTPSGDWVKGGSTSDTKFAGSWAQDFTQGVSGIVDTGVDVDADGDSAARMTDPESVYAFQLHGGRTRWRLVYVVTPTDIGDPVQLHYPEVGLSDGKVGAANGHVIHESGHHSALVFANGPMLGYGHWSWLVTLPSTLLLDVPNVLPPGTAPNGWKGSILDAGCWRSAVLLGLDRATGLRTWIRDRYSLFELVGVATTDGSVSDNQVYREADEFTITFLLPGPKAGAQALVNSCREYAPSVVFPTREFNPLTWERTGTWSARAYALDQGPRRYISSGRRFSLAPVSGSDITSTSTVVVVSGYFVRDHMMAVTNNEVPTDYELRIDGDLWANMTPWAGNRSVLGGAVQSQGFHVANATNQSGSFFTVWNDDGGIWIRRSDFAVPTFANITERVSETPGDQQPRLRVDVQTSRLFAVWNRDGSMLEAFSDDDGETWSEESEIDTDVRWSDTTSDERGFAVRAKFVYDSGDSGPGTIWVQVQGPGDSAFGPFVQVEDLGGLVSFSDSTFAIHPVADNRNSWVLSAIKDGESDPSSFISWDECETWTEI